MFKTGLIYEQLWSILPESNDSQDVLTEIVNS